jgi:hypothetical protein
MRNDTPLREEGDDLAVSIPRTLTDPARTISNDDLKMLIDAVYALAQGRGEATVIVTNPKEAGRTCQDMEAENTRWVVIGKRDYWPRGTYHVNVRTLPDLAAKLEHLPNGSVRFLAIGAHGSEVGSLVSWESVGAEPDTVRKVAVKLADDAVVFVSACCTVRYLANERDNAYVPDAFGATFIATKDVVFGWANSQEEVCPESKEYRDTEWDILRPTSVSPELRTLRSRKQPEAS